MECPTCGLVNPNEAETCDCGYDFTASKSPDFPGWPISLAWRQKVAAFWSISWPAWISSALLIGFLTIDYSVDRFKDNLFALGLIFHLGFFTIQALLTRRLVRKNYRSFRVYVVREGGTQSRTLSFWEAVSVWVWILGPQLAFLTLLSLGVWLWGTKLQSETLHGIASLSQWLWLLVVGPYSVGIALRMNYPGFHLQAHGFRYI